MIASAVAIVFAPRAAIRGGTQSLAARRRSCSSVRLPGVGGVRSGGVGVYCEESASGASEGFGGKRVSQGRGCGKRRHCLSFQSTTFQLPYKCEVL